MPFGYFPLKLFDICKALFFCYTGFPLNPRFLSLIRHSRKEPIAHAGTRLGRHVVEGTGQKVCRKHHPDGHLTAAHVRERYHIYLGGKPGKG